MAVTSGRLTNREAPWRDHYPDVVPTHLGYPSRPAWCLLQRAAEESPERIACWHLEEHWTYADMWRRAQLAATRLVGLGVRPGDRVALLLPNLPEYLVALNGIWLAGATVVSASPLMAPAEVSALLAATGARVLITLDVLSGLVPSDETAPETVLVVSLRDRLRRLKRVGYALARLLKFQLGRPDGPIRWLDWDDDSGETGNHNIPPAGYSAGKPALILPTGGTTGTPRAVVLTHGNLIANAWQLYHWAGRRTAQDTLLAVLPFFHSYGLTTCGLTGLAMQATLVIHHRFQIGTVLELFERHRPTVFPAVPTMLVALNDRIRSGHGSLAGLDYCISGGAPLPTEVAEEFSRHTGAVVVEGYGLSEAGPVTHVGPLDGTARPDTIGLPLPDTQARIVDIDDHTRTLLPGEVGELCIRGPQVMQGYLDDPFATAAVLQDGWLSTGDLATQDADGFFRVVDRLKDLIITSGFNVYPNEVEEVLRGFPQISDAAVIGVPDAERGQKVKALLALHPGTQFDPVALEAYLDHRLARHKRPREVEVVHGDLPRNFLGKVLRRHLREDAA